MCPSCGLKHRVKKRRLYLRAVDALNSGVTTIYIA
jgi:hypothetical protein